MLKIQFSCGKIDWKPCIVRFEHLPEELCPAEKTKRGIVTGGGEAVSADYA